jgi:hypothetical protein
MPKGKFPYFIKKDSSDSQLKIAACMISISGLISNEEQRFLKPISLNYIKAVLCNSPHFPVFTFLMRVL